MSPKPNSPDSSMDLCDLLGAPLLSTMEADTYAARKLMDFLHEFGFERSPPEPNAENPRDTAEADFGRLRVLSFGYNQPQQDGGALPMRLTVPALTLVPLPLLQVTEADFDFALHIVSAARPNETSSPSSTEGSHRKLLSSPNGYRFKALLARGGTKDSQDSPRKVTPSIGLNLKVHVKMRHADMPAGISTMLQFLGEAISRTKDSPPARPVPDASTNSQPPPDSPGATD